MSLNSLYHKTVSAITLFVMIWNIFGWVGAGLIVNHMHSHDEGDYCEISFCSCEVADGQSYCTCHHPELHHKNANEDHRKSNQPEPTPLNNDFCFYSSPHPVDNTQTEALLGSAKFNALFESQNAILIPYGAEQYTIDQPNRITSGYSADLLRPPRV